VKFLVLTEAETMFNLGFEDDIRDIMLELPRDRQIFMTR
jgi:superfamily II DNA/RNA helicase